MGKKKTEQKREKVREFIQKKHSKLSDAHNLPLNPVHATDEKNASDVIQLKGDKNITNISYAAF